MTKFEKMEAARAARGTWTPGPTSAVPDPVGARRREFFTRNNKWAVIKDLGAGKYRVVHDELDEVTASTRAFKLGAGYRARLMRGRDRARMLRQAVTE